MNFSSCFSDLLKYHVVSGVYYSKGLSSGSVTTLAGKSVMITALSGKYQEHFAGQKCCPKQDTPA